MHARKTVPSGVSEGARSASASPRRIIGSADLDNADDHGNVMRMSRYLLVDQLGAINKVKGLGAVVCRRHYPITIYGERNFPDHERRPRSTRTHQATLRYVHMFPSEG